MPDSSSPPAPQPAPEDEARRIGAHFDRVQPHPWETAGSDVSPWGQARVCRVGTGRVLHVVGASEMAERLRDLYSAGAIVGWQLQPMDQSRTPLEEYESEFAAIGKQDGGSRGYHQLRQAGFAFGEEVAACPDEALLKIRNIGQATLDKIRRIVGGPPAPSTRATAPDHHREPTAPGQILNGRLSASTLARYPDLVRGLAASGMPASALETIAQSLEREAVPPADQLVTLLLETAGQTRLLDMYRATHQEKSPQ
ncbi:hypothetical protein L3Q65_00310 (plasmid) [Amycolatopsis sp. FU40]|uniref:hypothetical protein n=1 Tax=Amycolatopsis sp. FU40 TaxID=2914159 RepID=UPI001F1D5926|nr:hypothetical protein [Amycolatopsis sp. FU40]UKD50772.1 hypothetical protein L3Q65_00310 [Amycolatopsis sp. FU40]